MLTAAPRSWFSWDFTLAAGEERLAEIDISWWREKGVLTIANKPYRVYREAPLIGAFVMESDGIVLARAEKPSALRRRMLVEHAGTRYELKPLRSFSRDFQLLAGTEVVGTLSASGLLSRRMNIALPEELPLPVRVFVVWLTVILWKRDFEAAT
jgi:hypothetical protein